MGGPALSPGEGFAVRHRSQKGAPFQVCVCAKWLLSERERVLECVVYTARFSKMGDSFASYSNELLITTVSAVASITAL
eukprot:49725-Eustigmatos_ZCMA.PRE.1